MRIISGKYKGRIIKPPSDLPVRPTTDFAKTGLFNILENRLDIESTQCLDLYSGTGSISYELISRGANSVTAVDQNRNCIAFIESTIQKLDIDNLSTVKSDVIRFLKHATRKYNVIFADPPYDLKVHRAIHELIFSNRLLTENGYLVIEHSSREDYSELPNFEFTRKYGNVGFSFFLNLDPEV